MRLVYDTIVFHNITYTCTLGDRYFENKTLNRFVNETKLFIDGSLKFNFIVVIILKYKF